MVVAAGEMNSLVAKHLAEMVSRRLLFVIVAVSALISWLRKLHIRLKLKLLSFQH